MKFSLEPQIERYSKQMELHRKTAREAACLTAAIRGNKIEKMIALLLLQ
ncbi:MAG: hypothetical protein FWG30_05460 [Eubacteriaceae bacterium]|nr:hypothetical protein [Eubacteriaceae bacterium]